MENKKKVLLPTVEKQEEGRVSRRGFLKKAVYSAPVLMSMGQLVKPVDANADSKVSGHPDDGWNPW